VYVLMLRGRRYYVGMSENVAHRIQQHINGRGARVTRQVPVVDIYSVTKFRTRDEAARGEKLEYHRLCAIHGKHKVSMGLQFADVARVGPAKQRAKRKSGAVKREFEHFFTKGGFTKGGFTKRA
jgi:hypothetical protein